MKNWMQRERDTLEKTSKFLKDGYTTPYFSISLLKTGTGLLEMWKKKLRSIICHGLYSLFGQVFLFAKLLVIPD